MDTNQLLFSIAQSVILHLRIIQQKNIIGRLFQYFQIYFFRFPIPTRESLFLLILSMLAVESADSIHILYKHFLSRVTEKTLNAFYYACSYAKIAYYKFMNIAARLALQNIPENWHNEPVFLCIGDTMITKFGQKFENTSKLFDHAAHNSSNYLNGHCFVSLMLFMCSCMEKEQDCLPVCSLGISYVDKRNFKTGSCRRHDTLCYA